MSDGTFFWRLDIQFGRITGVNGEAVIFNGDTVDHNLDLENEHNETRVVYEALEILTNEKIYYATEARMAKERDPAMASENCLEGKAPDTGKLVWVAKAPGVNENGFIKIPNGAIVFDRKICDHDFKDQELSHDFVTEVDYLFNEVGNVREATCVRKLT